MNEGFCYDRAKAADLIKNLLQRVKHGQTFPASECNLGGQHIGFAWFYFLTAIEVAVSEVYKCRLTLSKLNDDLCGKYSW